MEETKNGPFSENPVETWYNEVIATVASGCMQACTVHQRVVGSAVRRLRQEDSPIIIVIIVVIVTALSNITKSVRNG